MFHEDYQSEILQGTIGDCYLTTVLNQLSQNQQQKLFYTQQYNKSGCFVLYFYINGFKTPVMVDDWLPYRKNGKLAFAYCKTGEIWASLVEKAWAKLHGSFARIENADVAMFYNALTGLACDTIYH